MKTKRKENLIAFPSIEYAIRHIKPAAAPYIYRSRIKITITTEPYSLQDPLDRASIHHRDNTKTTAAKALSSLIQSGLPVTHTRLPNGFGTAGNDENIGSALHVYRQANRMYIILTSTRVSAPRYICTYRYYRYIIIIWSQCA